jgi:NAD(P)-dependent dehydrogenase (short-subunit alcohol dehydrogenase family)
LTFETNVLGMVLSMKHEVRRHAGPAERQHHQHLLDLQARARRGLDQCRRQHAVEGITNSVALEIAKSGIRVNAVAPGPTDTGMPTRFAGAAGRTKAVLATHAGRRRRERGAGVRGQ